MSISFKPAFVTVFAGPAFATIIATAAGAQNATGGANIHMNVMTPEAYMAMAHDHMDCMAVREVYDRHGHRLGQAMISTCK
jgi:hypothetical protein